MTNAFDDAFAPLPVPIKTWEEIKKTHPHCYVVFVPLKRNPLFSMAYVFNTKAHQYLLQWMVHHNGMGNLPDYSPTNEPKTPSDFIRLVAPEFLEQLIQYRSPNFHFFTN